MKLRRLFKEPDLLISMAFLLGFFVICSLQVVVRFVLTVPLSWTEELVAALVIWMTFFGVIAVERKRSQIRVELLEDLLPPKPLALLYTAFDVAILACLIAIIIGGWHTISETGYQRTPALGIPINSLVAIVPLASIALLVIVLRNAWQRLREAWA
ncbi:MAG: TRAP transporter small permease subunit [Pseudomonadota bacterium]